MEVTSFEAVNMAKGMCTEIIPVSPKMVTIQTEANEKIWKDAITDLMCTAPDACILRLRWKPSHNGGRPWVVPEAKPQQF